MLKYQVIISSDSPHALADVLLSLPDDSGEGPTYSEASDADQGDTAVEAPKKRGRKPKDPTAGVAPAPVPAPPLNTDVSDVHPGVQALAGGIPVPPTPAAPPAVVAPPSALIPAAPAAPPAASVPQPIATPAAPTLEQLKDAMTILMSKVSVQEAQAILKKYTGFGGLLDLLKDGPEWAPIAHYVLSNYPAIPDSVQPRAA